MRRSPTCARFYISRDIEVQLHGMAKSSDTAPSKNRSSGANNANISFLNHLFREM